MDPDNGTIFVLLYNNKIMETSPKPSAEFLLRSYGKPARIIKIANEQN